MRFAGTFALTMALAMGLTLQVGAVEAQDIFAGHVPAAAPGSLPAKWRTLSAMPRPGTAERFALDEEFRAGLIDPLALVTQIAGGAPPVPPRATYHQACSQALGSGAAAFTFGMDADPGILARHLDVMRMPDGVAKHEALERLSRDGFETGRNAGVLRAASDFLQRESFTVAGSGVTLHIYTPTTRHTRIKEAALASFNPYRQCIDSTPSGPLYVIFVR